MADRRRRVLAALLAGVVSSLVLVGVAQPVGAGLGNTINVDSLDRGWYTADGFHDPNNLNYLVGNEGSTFRNFFVFDLSAITGTVTSATLSAVSPGSGGSSTYVLHDVTTSISALRAGGSGLTSTYADLGDGTILGSVPTPGNPVVVPLNASGVTYVQNALGGQVAFGGDYPGANNHLFADSQNEPASSIILSLECATGCTVTPPTPSCDGGPPATAPDGYNLIVGTGNNDRGGKALNGTSGNDLIFGLGGDDEIFGKGGDDVICAGSGNDYAEGGDGADTMRGEGGKDELKGGAGNDDLGGGNGADTLNGGADSDECVDADGTVFKNCETVGIP